MNLIDEAKAVTEIVALSGGTLVGRVKLQCVAYFLEQAGVGYGFEDFDIRQRTHNDDTHM